MTTLDKFKEIIIEIIMGEEIEKRLEQIIEKKIQEHIKNFNDRWIGEDEAKDLLGLSGPTMLKLRKMNKLKHKKFGKKIKYRYSDFFNIDE